MSNSKSLLPLIVASLVALIILSGHLVNGQRQLFSRDVKSESNAGYQRYCGKRISEALMMLCRYNYNGPAFSKRTSQKTDDEYQALSDDIDPRADLRELDYPGLSAFGALSANDLPILRQAKGLSFKSDVNFRRHRRGIVEECCHSPCSYETLRLYCENFV